MERVVLAASSSHGRVSVLSSVGDLLLSEEDCDTTSDLMLAQMLQMQFDREFDDQLRREEKKFNGDSKG